jgi:hypothetical protein
MDSCWLARSKSIGSVTVTVRSSGTNYPGTIGAARYDSPLEFLSLLLALASRTLADVAITRPGGLTLLSPVESITFSSGDTTGALAYLGCVSPWLAGVQSSETTYLWAGYCARRPLLRRKHRTTRGSDRTSLWRHTGDLAETEGLYWVTTSVAEWGYAEQWYSFMSAVMQDHYPVADDQDNVLWMAEQDMSVEPVAGDGGLTRSSINWLAE